MKSWDQFKKKKGVNLNEVFLILKKKWGGEGDKTINTFQVSAQSQPKNIIKMSNL